MMTTEQIKTERAAMAVRQAERAQDERARLDARRLMILRLPESPQRAAMLARHDTRRAAS